jgi:hypothetical protein
MAKGLPDSVVATAAAKSLFKTSGQRQYCAGIIDFEVVN